jgi:glucose/arabinose dehydrogenase
VARPYVVQVRVTLVLALAVSVGCRQEGRSPDRPPPRPQAEAAPVESGSAAQPVGEPALPGSDSLGAVPPAVAAKVALREVAHGLRRPVLLVAAPNDARRRLFIVEQGGTIRFLEGGKLSTKTFFTIGGLANGNEQGLLGLAFHPLFATNGRLYVNYTTRDKATHIDEYKVSKADPDAVDMQTKREVIVIAQPYSNHNGGNLLFGPDGKLYTGMGDGGAANDPHDNGQNDKALLGKLLRFDVELPKPLPEIVHKGLRNPWRFSFDARTGDLLIGDVGQNLWEYVHGVPAGDTSSHNFGWNIVEGSHCFDADTGQGADSCNTNGLTLPLVEYPHEEGCSITGGFVYRGKALPDLDGRYFYADFCTGLLRSFVLTKGLVREHWDWKPAIDKQGVVSQVSSFGVDHDGELYIVELTGSIYKLVPAA